MLSSDQKEWGAGLRSNTAHKVRPLLKRLDVTGRVPNHWAGKEPLFTKSQGEYFHQYSETRIEWPADERAANTFLNLDNFCFVI